MSASKLYRLLLVAAAALAMTVVVLGAYVRLSSAGLSCPDWPGCYGQLTVGAALAHASQIDEQFPYRPLEPGKAIKEMVHRYAAGTLGVLIGAAALLAWRNGRRMVLPLLLISLVVFQALLGMWTVTLNLKPLVVTAHLIGGMSVLALLWWSWLETHPRTCVDAHGLRPFAVAGLVLLAMQIALGGWTSSHYAGLACSGFPLCNGAWWPHADFTSGFGEHSLNAAGLVAIQWAHRLGAAAVALYLGWLAWRSRRATAPIRQAGTALALLLLLQITLGITNVLAHLPLPLATAHDAVAALLLLSLVTLIQRLPSATHTARPGEPS